MTTRFVRLTCAAIASQSYGTIVRRSSTPTLMPSFSACCAASSDRCTSAPHVTTSDVVALAPQARLAERNHEVFAGVLALVVGLPVQVLVLEEEHRVVAADRGAQQPGRVDARSTDTRCGCRGSARRCSRRTGCDTARRRAGSRRSARGSTTGHDQRVARSVAHHRHLVADLHHRRPDVVEELNLDHRLQPARRHADGAADDVGFGERRVEDAIVAVEPLQPVRQLEDAALAGHDRQRVLLAGIRDVLAEDDDARVARHLVLQRPVDRRDHRVGLAFGLRRRVERRGRRIDVRRVDPEHRPCSSARLRRGERLQRRLVHLALDVGARWPRARRRWRARSSCRNSANRAIGSRARFGLALRRRLVQLLVVRQRVRVRAG